MLTEWPGTILSKVRTECDLRAHGCDDVFLTLIIFYRDIEESSVEGAD